MSVDFTQPWDLSDITFIAEGQCAYASKTILSMWSPVMKAMFRDDFKEKNAVEIELPGKLFDDVLELMQVIHPPNKELDESNVGIILPLAREYQMDELTKRCEDFLLARPPSVQGFVLAEEFDLMTLKNSCMTYIQMSRLRDLQREDNFDMMTKETKIQILLEKSLKYEKVLTEIQDVIEGRKPEQMRFHVGGTQCTFSCGDKDGGRDPHNAGIDRGCRSCAVYMTKRVHDKLKDMPSPY